MSAERRDDEYLADIREAVDRIGSYVGQLSFEDFLQDAKTQDAVIRNLQVIGEAAKRVSLALRGRLDLPWREMAGIRDKIVHDYFGIDFEVVWEVVTHDLPALRGRLGGNP